MQTNFFDGRLYVWYGSKEQEHLSNLNALPLVIIDQLCSKCSIYGHLFDRKNSGGNHLLIYMMKYDENYEASHVVPLVKIAPTFFARQWCWQKENK